MKTSSTDQTMRSKWLTWEPTVAISAESAESGPTKPPEPRSVGFDGASESHRVDEPANHPLKPFPKSEPRTEWALKGQVVELWSNTAGRLFLVADEEDAHLTMERYCPPRGEIYTASELRTIVAVGDPAVVAEIHEYKRRFDGRIRPKGIGA